MLSLDVESLYIYWSPDRRGVDFSKDEVQPFEEQFPLGIEETLKLINLGVTNDFFFLLKVNFTNKGLAVAQAAPCPHF